MDRTELLGLFARSLAKVDTDHPLAMRLCEACVDILRAEGAALTLSAAPGERLAVSTPGMFDQLESLQEVLGVGPLHQALAEERLIVMHVDPVADDYPVFSQLAGSIVDEATVYATPMRAAGRVVGVLSLYVTAEPQTRSAEDLGLVADAVGAALLGAAESLDWSERTQIHRAIGMVVVQLRISPEDAFAVIRARAFTRSTSLLSVAQDVLGQRLQFSLGDSD